MTGGPSPRTFRAMKVDETTDIAGRTDAHSGAGFRDVHYTSRDGLRLHVRDYPACETAERLPLICLPGLTRNVRDFHKLALILSGQSHSEPVASPRRIVSFDYRGRGASQWDREPKNYNLAVETDDVLDGLAALGIHRAGFLGTSRGALIIHMLAAVRPTILAAAILNDAGPVIEGAGLAQIKAYLTRLPPPKDRADARRLLREAHGGSFTALGDKDWAEMADAIYAERKGKLVGDYDPALVDQLAGIDFNTPLPTLWPQFDGLRDIPLMTIRGENSQLLSERTVEEMKARHPAMDVVIVAGHGHAPILHLAGLPGRIPGFLDNN